MRVIAMHQAPSKSSSFPERGQRTAANGPKREVDDTVTACTPAPVPDISAGEPAQDLEPRGFFFPSLLCSSGDIQTPQGRTIVSSDELVLYNNDNCFRLSMSLKGVSPMKRPRDRVRCA